MLHSDAQMVCNEFGEWSFPSLACVQIDVCGPRPLIPNGLYEEIHERPWPLGAVQQFYCDEGYQLFGKSNIECKGSRNWTRPGVCMASCGPVPTVINGAVDVGKKKSRNPYLKLTCLPGHEMYGESHIYCDNATNHWTLPGVCLEKCRLENSTVIKWPRPENLIAFWPFDDEHGLMDVSPHKLNLELDTTQAILSKEVDGPFTGNSFTVKRDNEHIGYRGDLFRATSFTISFYFFTMGFQSSPILMFFFERPHFSLRYVPPNYLEIRRGSGTSPTGEVVALFDRVFTPFKWNFVAITFDGEYQAITVFDRSGVLVNPMELGHKAIEGWNDGHWFYVGRAPNDTECCIGMKKTDSISCLMVYDTPLSELEIFKLQRSCRCQRSF